MAIIEGIAYWTHIAEPNTKGAYPSGKYEINVGNLDEKNIKVIKDMGMEKKLQNKGDEQGTYVKLKNKRRPKLINALKEEYPEGTLVGNGSKVKVGINVYEAGKFGKQLGVNVIQVLELVEYGGDAEGGLDEFDVVDTDSSFQVND